MKIDGLNNKVSIKYDKKYQDDPRIKQLNLTNEEFKRFYPQIVAMFNNQDTDITRDELGKIHITVKTLHADNGNWIHKGFLDKFNNLTLSPEHFGSVIPASKLKIINILLNDLKTAPSSHYFYSFDTKDIYVLIAYANHLSLNKKVSFINLEDLYKMKKVGKTISNYFDDALNADIVFIVNLRDFETHWILSDYLSIFLREAHYLDIPIVFFSPYKIIELSRKLTKKFQATSFSPDELIKTITLIVKTEELSF